MGVHAFRRTKQASSSYLVNTNSSASFSRCGGRSTNIQPLFFSSGRSHIKNTEKILVFFSLGIEGPRYFNFHVTYKNLRRYSAS